MNTEIKKELGALLEGVEITGEERADFDEIVLLLSRFSIELLKAETIEERLEILEDIKVVKARIQLLISLRSVKTVNQVVDAVVGAISKVLLNALLT